ncbi:ATP-binding protein [Halosimplex aquaticum]|uniref:histidine kinase n=1 Tax=Halosimplex aquaticum TaxID=3026162 RepID=A0ABD5YAL2_9EURY|nr:HAMP domain-containing sensor histidine kinase [Halosimplex aquaticum]
MTAVLRNTDRDLAQTLMTGFWVLFTVAYLAFFYLFRDAREIADASLDGYLEVILLGIPTVVLLAGSMWLRDADVDRELRPRIVGWTVGMTLFFALAMYAALFVVETRFDHGEQWLILMLSVGFGASSGTVMGVLAVRSKQRERERNRSQAVARRKERERSQLEYLNHYLRHEVLNEAQKINGYATLLARDAEADGDGAAYLETIRDSSDEIAAFVGSIRTVLDASDHEPDLTAVDLRAVIEAEVEQVRRTHPSVAVETSGPESAAALTGELVNRVFRNLLENAIEHNGSDLSIAVDVSVDDDWVTVGIRDDGSGVSPEERESLFEPPEAGDHGYGLFLTKNLVQVYGGTIALAETGPDGTEFAVRFPAAGGSSDTAAARRSRQRLAV